MRFLIAFLLLTSIAYADDVVCFDAQGKITAKMISVDLKQAGIMNDQEQWVRLDCVRVSRDVIKTLDNTYKVDITATKQQMTSDSSKSDYFQNSAIVEKSASELKADSDAAKAIKDAADAKLQAVKDELKGAGISDETVDYLVTHRN